MNQKNSLDIDNCFKDLENPTELFNEWFNEAKKTEINDPNALALATADENGKPSVRMVLLKDYGENGFTFYTNLESQKSTAIANNPFGEMCFHWKSLRRQIRISGLINRVSDEVANKYFSSRDYGSKIGAWASEQSKVLNSRKDLIERIKGFKKVYPDADMVPRPDNWSGWNLKPKMIEFWLEGNNRIHERLRYFKESKNWVRKLINP
tara:strand:- start:1081 stop:1704 length:624 start_codon:yes stop_codon:yes gene_type:complete